jgi:predicted amidohydrolase YtcJ
LAWARLRRRPGDRDGHVFEPEQRLSGAEALWGYTGAAAKAVGEETVAGRLTPGRRADLTVFAADPIATPADELPDLPVRLMMVGGRVVHDDGSIP